MNSYRLISLDDTVVFPGMPVTLSVDPGSDKRVLLVPRRGDEYAKVGVVAEVTERVKLGGRGYAVSLMGLHRAMPGAAVTDGHGHLRVEEDERPDNAPPASLTHELEREYRAVVEELLQLRGDDGRISAFLRSIVGAGPLADTAGYSAAQAVPGRRRFRRTETTARILPEPSDGRDPLGARPERSIGSRGVSQEDRRRWDA